MTDWIKKHLTKKQINEISDCVRRAEVRTTAEIVPVIIRQSTPDAYVQFFLMLFLLSFELLVVTEFFVFEYQDKMLFLLLFIAAFVFNYFLSQFMIKFGSVRRLFLFKNDIDRSVWSRAELEYYRHKVHLTEHNHGVLLFVSVLERKAIIYADPVIAEKITNKEWQTLLNDLIYKLSVNEWNEGFTQAIDAIGKKLATHFPIADLNNPNEISNELIILND